MMNKKLFTQIRNERHSNLWLLMELLLVSVVMWYVVDYLFVKGTVYNQPKGFDVEHCYLIKMSRLTSKSTDYIAEGRKDSDDINELVERLRRRPEIEAVSLSQNSFPYNGSNSGIGVKYGPMSSSNSNSNYVVHRLVTPDFLRVFRYQGTRGETPEQLAALLVESQFMVSDNLFEQKYHTTMTPFVGKRFFLAGDTTQTFTLAAALKTVRYTDYKDAYDDYSLVGLLPHAWYSVHSELCVRVRANQDHDFITRLKADSEKQFRVGNIFFAEIRSFTDIRRNFLQFHTINLRNYVTGMSFLMLNVLLGLLGTFWFRTHQRRCEMALMMAMGSTRRAVFGRLLTEAFLLLTIATIPALRIDYYIADAELNSWRSGTTLEAGRFVLTTVITYCLIGGMILIGCWFPARKAMNIQPAEALHDE